jgi:hypothetical protein
MLQSVLRPPSPAADIALGVRLSNMSDGFISPADVAQLFNKAKLRYVLVGGHAVNGYSGRPRSTVDVDVVVQFPKKAATAIAAAYPKLICEDHPVVTRFKTASGDEAIDLLKPSSSPLWKQLLKRTAVVKIGAVAVSVPRVEGMLAAKLAAMTSITRRLPDRQQDAVDFMRIVGVHEQLDMDELKQLGDLVHPGGGDEICQHVVTVRAGKPLQI